MLFFYPAAMTGGWTKESCHFRDLASEFADLHHFDYPLLSDPQRVVAEQFGVKRGGFGSRLGFPVKRATFVIGTDQRIVEVISSETDMNTHADRALAALRAPQPN